jgi:hypothetical protein
MPFTSGLVPQGWVVHSLNNSGVVLTPRRGNPEVAGLEISPMGKVRQTGVPQLSDANLARFEAAIQIA